MVMAMPQIEQLRSRVLSDSSTTPGCLRRQQLQISIPKAVRARYTKNMLSSTTNYSGIMGETVSAQTAFTLPPVSWTTGTEGTRLHTFPVSLYSFDLHCRQVTWLIQEMQGQRQPEQNPLKARQQEFTQVTQQVSLKEHVSQGLTQGLHCPLRAQQPSSQLLQIVWLQMRQFVTAQRVQALLEYSYLSEQSRQELVEMQTLHSVGHTTHTPKVTKLPASHWQQVTRLSQSKQFFLQATHRLVTSLRKKAPLQDRQLFQDQQAVQAPKQAWQVLSRGQVPTVQLVQMNLDWQVKQPFEQRTHWLFSMKYLVLQMSQRWLLLTQEQQFLTKHQMQASSYPRKQLLLQKRQTVSSVHRRQPLGQATHPTLGSASRQVVILHCRQVLVQIQHCGERVLQATHTPFPRQNPTLQQRAAQSKPWMQARQESGVPGIMLKLGLHWQQLSNFGQARQFSTLQAAHLFGWSQQKPMAQAEHSLTVGPVQKRQALLHFWQLRLRSRQQSCSHIQQLNVLQKQQFQRQGMQLIDWNTYPGLHRIHCVALFTQYRQLASHLAQILSLKKQPDPHYWQSPLPTHLRQFSKQAEQVIVEKFKQYPTLQRKQLNLIVKLQTRQLLVHGWQFCDWKKKPWAQDWHMTAFNKLQEQDRQPLGQALQNPVEGCRIVPSWQIMQLWNEMQTPQPSSAFSQGKQVLPELMQPAKHCLHELLSRQVAQVGVQGEHAKLARQQPGWQCTHSVLLQTVQAFSPTAHLNWQRAHPSISSKAMAIYVMNIELVCFSCAKHYDLQSRLPLQLPLCKHTFCSLCIQRTLKAARGRFVCDIDQTAFAATSLQDFEPNQVILAQLRLESDHQPKQHGSLQRLAANAKDRLVQLLQLSLSKQIKALQGRKAQLQRMIGQSLDQYIGQQKKQIANSQVAAQTSVLRAEAQLGGYQNRIGQQLLEKGLLGLRQESLQLVRFQSKPLVVPAMKNQYRSELKQQKLENSVICSIQGRVELLNQQLDENDLYFLYQLLRGREQAIHLRLIKAGINDSLFAVLTEMVAKMPQLQTLNLSKNAISAKSITLLKQAQTWRRVKWVNLSLNPIGKALKDGQSLAVAVIR